LIDLIEARRIDEERLKNLDIKQLLQIAERYRSQAVSILPKAIGKL